MQEHAYDLSTILPESSLIGVILGGIFNYQEAPTVGEAAVYVAFLAITFFFFLRPAPSPRPRLQAADLGGDANAGS